MGPVKDKWSAEYKPALEDFEIHLTEEWDSAASSDMPVYHKRRTAGLWTALASLAVMLALAAAYGYSVISKHNADLAWLSGRVKSFSAVGDRANRLEARLKDWSARQENLAARVQNLDAVWKSGLNDVRLHVAKLVTNAYQKEHNELNQRTATLNTQIAEVASRQHTEQAHLAQLERELADTRQELASVRATYSRELAALQQQQISSQQQIASLDNILSTDQIIFEAVKDHDEEIMPGVSLHLTGTDPAHQQFRGWIWLGGSRHRIWVQDHPIERPVVFYPTPGGEAYELVVTRVNHKEATGYLLVPSDARPDVASNSKPINRPGQGNL